MTYKPEDENKKQCGDPDGVCVLPGRDHTSRKRLEGIALRRRLHFEPLNREKKCCYIEKELLDALPSNCDLNFEVNLALEHMITRHSGARVAVVNSAENLDRALAMVRDY